jgi:hypothetical protein
MALQSSLYHCRHGQLTLFPRSRRIRQSRHGGSSGRGEVAGNPVFQERSEQPRYTLRTGVNKIMWKVYIWAFCVLLVLSAIGRVVLFFKRRDLVSPLDVVEAFVGLAVMPALLGFAYQRQIAPQALWMILSLVITGMSIYQFFTPKMTKLYEKGWLVAGGVIALQGAIGAPALWALVKYSFFEHPLM